PVLILLEVLVPPFAETGARTTPWHTRHIAERYSLFTLIVLGEGLVASAKSGSLDERFADGLFASDVLPLLATSRSYEDALYLQILRSRLEAIEKLEKLINKDELEKVLQEHLFDNLWLLDPSWEGAAGDADMEIALTRIRKGILFDKSERENQKQGRIDIQYRSAEERDGPLVRDGPVFAAGHELVEQGNKYHQALTEVIQKRAQPSSGLNVVFVLGQKPQLGYLGDRTEEERIHNAIGHLGGRVLYYDQLLHNAQQRYREYRER
ncbi:low temperature requirement protein A, partial [Bacillus sp. S34]|nr:low temperature requirement protein A [Bacillus sp. S34]